MYSWLLRLQNFLDTIYFRDQRADYFNYLHAVLTGSDGRITIRELFDRDAIRYGQNSSRGRLSSTWAQGCELNGGDLYSTWLGYFPEDELLLIRASQGHGNQSLLAAFNELAKHLDLLIEAKNILWATLGVAILAICLATSLILSLPWWTVPALQGSFNGIPTEYLGHWAKSLFNFADFLQTWGWLIPFLILIVIFLFLLSLPRYTGEIRNFLDKYGLWRLYRHIHSLRFLSLITILLCPDRSNSKQLRPVIALFQSETNFWLNSHIKNILLRIDTGITDASAFDTGLFDKNLYWFLTDMANANGLQNGLLAVQQRIRSHWLKSIKKQALILRWLCLLIAVAIVLGIGLWHYAAIDDLRKAWLMYHSS